MDSVPVTLDEMAKRPLTPTEAWFVDSMYEVINEIYAGNIVASGVCAANADGRPFFFYFNTPRQPVLDPALSRLMGIYTNKTGIGERVNAPTTNRSYETH